MHLKTPRYRADSLLIDLAQHKPDSLDYIIGLTQVDISTTKRDAQGQILTPIEKYTDWGIFGLGYRPGPSCVVSTYRLKHTNHTTFVSRLKKIAIHEIGHNTGLPHCQASPHCVMQDAVESIRTIDAADMQLCKSCRLK